MRDLDSASRFEEELPEVESEFRDRDFNYYLAHREEMPPQITNDIEAVRNWLTAG